MGVFGLRRVADGTLQQPHRLKDSTTSWPEKLCLIVACRTRVGRQVASVGPPVAVLHVQSCVALR